MTLIADLKDGDRKINIKVVITDKQPTREIEIAGKAKKVADCVAKDDSGTIRLALWDDECDKVDLGDIVQITNGYVKSFKNELELCAGKYGKLEIVQE